MSCTARRRRCHSTATDSNRPGAITGGGGASPSSSLPLPPPPEPEAEEMLLPWKPPLPLAPLGRSTIDPLCTTELERRNRKHCCSCRQIF